MDQNPDDSWDPNMYQGRTRQQVEASAKGVVVALFGFVAVVVLYILYLALM